MNSNETPSLRAIPVATKIRAMSTNRWLRMGAFLTAVALFAGSDVAKAQVTTTDAACRKMVQKKVGKLGALGMSTVKKCINNLLNGNIPATTICSDAFDSKRNVDAAIEKTINGIMTKCPSIPPSYPNCPSPANYDDAGGATSGVDSAAELADCEVTLSLQTVETLYNYILRPDGEALMASPKRAALAKCAKAIAKGATKVWKKISQVRGKCQIDSDATGGPYDYLCSFADSGGKIIAAVLKLQDGVMKDCGASTGLTQGDLALLHSCESSAAGIATCVTEAVKRNAGGVTASAFEFAGVCPSSMRVIVNSGGRNGQRNSSTRLDLGWTGLGHDQDFVDGFTGRFGVSCSSDDCSSCTLTASCEEGNCRCANNTAITCSTPFVAGGPCGANTCIVHLGPPLPLNAGNTPTCVVNTLPPPFSGTADLGTGQSTIPISSIAKVHLGISQTQPCPTCSGSGIGGVGTCNGGANAGASCTTDAINTSFGNTSYDCQPTPGQNVSGAGLKIDLALTDAPVDLTASDPCDDLAYLSCFGGACSLDGTTACQVDTDCSGVGLGTCNKASGPSRLPNACGDLTCNATSSELGTCTDTIGFCDGVVKTHGAPYLTCSSDAECTSLDPAAGSCSITAPRPCFVNPISDFGVAGTDGAELVATFGVGSVFNGGVNAAYGLPGPARVHLDVDLVPLCSDGSTTYQPGGANCP